MARSKNKKNTSLIITDDVLKASNVDKDGKNTQSEDSPTKPATPEQADSQTEFESEPLRTEKQKSERAKRNSDD